MADKQNSDYSQWNTSDGSGLPAERAKEPLRGWLLLPLVLFALALVNPAIRLFWAITHFLQLDSALELQEKTGIASAGHDWLYLLTSIAGNSILLLFGTLVFVLLVKRSFWFSWGLLGHLVLFMLLDLMLISIHMFVLADNLNSGGSISANTFMEFVSEGVFQLLGKYMIMGMLIIATGIYLLNSKRVAKTFPKKNAAAAGFVTEVRNIDLKS